MKETRICQIKLLELAGMLAAGVERSKALQSHVGINRQQNRVAGDAENNILAPIS